MSKKEEKQNKTQAVEKEQVQDEHTAKEAADNKDAVKDGDKTEKHENAESGSAAEGSCEEPDTEKIDSKKKDTKDALIEELQDKIKRQMAEFDNYRKRTEKEKSAMFEMGASDIIKKLLPIVDNFERGFKAVAEEELETPFAKGMDMVYKQTMKMLEDVNVKPIEAVGVEFNPELHNAVMHVEDDSVGDNIIIEEFEKGYTYRETVIRHSMVKVAN